MPWNRLDPPRRRAIYGSVVALLLTTAGCATPVGSEVDDPQRVAAQVETRYDSLDAYQTTVVRTITAGDRTETTRATITVETGSRMRVDYHTGPRAGTTVVTDEPANASLFPGDSDDSEPGHSSYGALAAQIVRTNNVTYRGQTRLGDHPAAILSVTPTANATADRAGPRITERLVWIDTERRVPLRIRTTWEENDRSVTETIQFTDVSLAVNGTNATSRSGGVGA